MTERSLMCLGKVGKVVGAIDSIPSDWGDMTSDTVSVPSLLVTICQSVPGRFFEVQRTLSGPPDLQEPILKGLWDHIDHGIQID